MRANVGPRAIFREASRGWSAVQFKKSDPTVAPRVIKRRRDP